MIAYLNTYTKYVLSFHKPSLLTSGPVQFGPGPTPSDLSPKYNNVIVTVVGNLVYIIGPIRGGQISLSNQTQALPGQFINIRTGLELNLGLSIRPRTEPSHITMIRTESTHHRGSSEP